MAELSGSLAFGIRETVAPDSGVWECGSVPQWSVLTQVRDIYRYGVQ